MDLSVATVTWNSARYIADQIKSVCFGCTGLRFEEIIVDNHSSDHTVKIVQEQFPQVQLIKNNYNAGFGRAYNQALKLAAGKYFLYLNPDMKILGEISPLLNYLETHQEVGILSGKLVGRNGEINTNALPRRFPSVGNILIMFFKIHHLFPSVLNNYWYKNYNWEQIQEVDSVRGSFMIVRRELVEKLGWAFDPRYYLWWEDVDLCREAKKLGYKVVYNPAVACVDEVGQSFKARNWCLRQWLFFKGAFIYFSKWGIKN